MALYYCRSIYQKEQSWHINPLILQHAKQGSILVFIPREQMKDRILDVADEYDDLEVKVVGWWELKDHGILDENGCLNDKMLYTFDDVVIVDVDRIDEQFGPVYQEIARTLCAT